MAFETIRLEKEDHVATITLNRPAKGNALNSTMHEELWEAWNDVRYDVETWTIILTGEGDRFCVGEDLEELAQSMRSGEVPVRYREPRNGRNWGFPYEHVKRRKNQIYKPIIVAVNGQCSGSGLVLVGQSDVILASESATFSMPGVSLGLVPVDEALYLADRIPVGEVLRLALMGEDGSLSAGRAQQIALATEVHAPDKLLERGRELALQINDQAGDAVRAMVITMHLRRDMGYDDSLVLGYEYHSRFENVENMLEGPRAFTEKRKPNWTIRPPHMG